MKGTGSMGSIMAVCMNWANTNEGGVVPEVRVGGRGGVLLSLRGVDLPVSI